MFSRRYTVLIADRSTGVIRRVTIRLRTVVTVATVVLLIRCSLVSAREWSARGDRPAPRRQLHPRGRKRQLPRSDRRAHHADSVARRRHRRAGRPRRARPGAGPRHAEAARRRESPRRRRQHAAERRDLQRPLDVAHVTRRHVRRAARPAPEASKAGCATSGDDVERQERWPRRRRRSGRRMAGSPAPLAAARIHSPASPGSIRASTSRPPRASRSTRRPTASSSRPRTPATTATSSSCGTTSV